MCIFHSLCIRLTVLPGTHLWTQGGEGGQEQSAQIEETGLPDLLAFSDGPTGFVGG